MFERNTVFTQARYRDDLVKSAEGYHLKVDTYEVSAPDDLDRVLRAVAGDRRAALLILPGPMIFAFHERLVADAERLAMPVVYPFEEMAEAGGLISYAPNLLDSYRSAARYVDRILRGANPGDLPIEQPKRLQLAVNLRTARSKGIRLPASILGRADRFIE
jgi:putative ABC transport system substrate-binding protein